MTTSWTAVTPDQTGELPGRQCSRCGAVGTHYLTCPGLRLPAGYSLSDPPGAECGRGLPAAARGPRSGPDHPDWPHPPNHL